MLNSNLENYDVVVVGAGFYGSVIAERIATILDKKVLVIDKREHIGGNAYSYKDEETGAEIHKYGSHIFHTSNESVWNYIRQFTEFNNYQHHVFTKYNEAIYSMPINLKTINDFYKKSFNPEEAQKFIEDEVKKNYTKDPQNLEEKAISLIGKPLYEAFIKGYTAKQWEVAPHLLPANIITRLPVRYNYNSRYFMDKYEGIPVDGYTKIFDRMLGHKNISVELGIDFFNIKNSISKNILVIYSGPIDRYFNYSEGYLSWRTIDFKEKRVEVSDGQGCACLNYANTQVPYTRVHEYQHYTPEKPNKSGRTVLFEEYSRKANKDDMPYYPINTNEDKKIYQNYRDLAKKEKNIIFGGRLGSYAYLDMHQVIAVALSDFKTEIEKFWD